MFDCNMAKSCTGGFECCGIFPLNIPLINKHQINQEYIVKQTRIDNIAIIETKDNYCIFLDRNDGKCLIYEDRPQICRDYGKVEGLLCHHIRPDGSIRTRAERREIKHRTESVIKEKLRRFKQRAKSNVDVSNNGEFCPLCNAVAKEVNKDA